MNLQRVSESEPPKDRGEHECCRRGSRSAGAACAGAGARHSCCPGTDGIIIHRAGDPYPGLRVAPYGLGTALATCDAWEFGKSTPSSLPCARATSGPCEDRPPAVRAAHHNTTMMCLLVGHVRCGRLLLGGAQVCGGRARVRGLWPARAVLKAPGRHRGRVRAHRTLMPRPALTTTHSA